MSVVVPPMSTTIIASFCSSGIKNAALHILLVGPLENARMGSLAAAQAGKMVPSFWMTKTGQWRLREEEADWEEYIVLLANDSIDVAVFSRSKIPMLATSLEQTIISIWVHFPNHCRGSFFSPEYDVDRNNTSTVAMLSILPL
jgi:hypothetical protein